MKASKGTERMFEIRLMVGKPETRCDYGGVSGKQGAAKGSREPFKARRQAEQESVEATMRQRVKGRVSAQNSPKISREPPLAE